MQELTIIVIYDIQENNQSNLCTSESFKRLFFN